VLYVPSGSVATDPDPDETARREVEIATEWDGTPAGLVGFAEGGWDAVRLGTEHGDLVDRLVLVSTPIPEEPTTQPLAAVSAKALLLYGSKDPAGGHRQATWWKDQIGGRIEMMPGAGHDILADVWPRVLSHLAPRRRRQD
jgi:pimeloyl-ACP methyl ester carboxylesterase